MFGKVTLQSLIGSLVVGGDSSMLLDVVELLLELISDDVFAESREKLDVVISGRLFFSDIRVN